MKFAVFAPVSKASPIGRVASGVNAALVSLGHEVIVISTDSATKRHQDGKKDAVMAWFDTEEVASTLKACDQAIFHVGDQFNYHQGALFWMGKLRGIVCLHDICLANLFLGWSKDFPDLASQIANSLHGPSSFKLLLSYQQHETSDQRILAYAPMTEWATGNAGAVVTHSMYAASFVQKHSNSPPRIAQLPCRPTTFPILRNTRKERHSELRILTFGTMRENKRPMDVIQAIAKDRALARITSYMLTGEIEPNFAYALTNFARANGVRLTITGRVTDAILAEIISSADIVCCLRSPALEASSASTLEAMQYGKPVLVLDHASYAELPDDVVVKITPSNVVTALGEALQQLALNPGRRATIGAMAQRWANKACSPEAYAKTLLQAALEAGPLKASRNTVAIVEAMIFFNNLIERWSDSEPAHKTEQLIQVGGEIAAMLRESEFQKRNGQH